MNRRTGVSAKSGKLPLNLELVALVVLIWKNLLSNRPLAAKKQILLDFVSPGDCPVLMLDAPAIDQELNNVRRTAIKFSPPLTTITIGLPSSEQRVQFAASEQKPGIPHHNQHKLFEPFERISVKNMESEKSFG